MRSKVVTFITAVCLLVLILAGCGAGGTEPSETPEPSEIADPTQTREPSQSQDPTETQEPTETQGPTEAQEPTENPAPTETQGPTETQAPTEAQEPTEAPAPTEAREPTESPAPTGSAEPTEPQTPTGGLTPGGSTEPSDPPEPTEDPETMPPNSLTVLTGQGRSFVGCGTERGYYYLTLGAGRLADGRDGHHLMYIDYATRQEVYLCSDPSCAHNTADCPSVFPTDTFLHNNVTLFTAGGKLYMLVTEPDREGVVVMGASGGASTQSGHAQLIRMNADGTGRTGIYTFDANLTVESFAAGDGGGLYFITKKVSTASGGGSTYFTATDRRLVRLDLATGKLSTVCGMDFGDNVDWTPAGAYGRELILSGIDFGRAVSGQEMKDDPSVYDNARDVFAALNVDTGVLRVFYRVPYPGSRSWALDGAALYYAVDGSGEIRAVSVLSGAERVLCRTSHDRIWGIVGGKLYAWEYDDAFYFIDPVSGSVSRCGLKNKTVGTHIDIVAEAGSQVLVIYDCDADFRSDGSFSTTKNYFGLISLADLVAGIGNYAPIKMVEAGM